MAGDWIKIEASTPDKPEVIGIADMLGIPPTQAFGALFMVWRWFDQHTTEGNASFVTKVTVDRLAGVTGFADAMHKVGWLAINDDQSITLPNFGRHCGETAKQRALTAKRVAKHKGKGNDQSNATGNDETVSGALPREEKRREETPLSEQAAAGTPEPVDKSPGVVPLPAASDQERAKTIADRLNGWAKKRGNPGNFQAAHPKIVEWVRLGVRDPHLKDAWDAADQARHRDGSAAPINTNFLHGFVLEEITESGLPPKGPDVCCVCGATATRKEGSEWYCSGHDRHSQRKAA